MTKREFINFLAIRNGFSVNFAEKILRAFLDSLEDGLFRDSSIKLPGIGTIKVKDSPPRSRRNPATGDFVEVPQGKRIIFRPSPQIKDDIN